MFAKAVVVADAQPRRLTLVFHVHRLVPNDTAGVKPIVRANRRQPREVNLRPDDTIRPQLDARINHGVWPNPDR
jgi:hypothetical protein